MNIDRIKLPRFSDRHWYTNNQPSWLIVHHDGVTIGDTDNPISRYIADANHSIRRNATVNYLIPSSQYHFMISRDGRILQGLDLDEMTPHCSNLAVNKKSIAITLQGNYMVQDLKLLQKIALEEVIRYLSNELPIQGVSWHRETSTLGYTACPGDNVIPFLTKLRNNEMTQLDDISNNIRELNDNIQKLINVIASKDTLDRLYLEILGRPVDPDGVQTHAGVSQEEVVKRLLESEEGQKLDHAQVHAITRKYNLIEDGAE